ncbi:hypothetical protein [Bacillus sp. OK048]|uniref:hypothetical protein n=1 Tax=Bacillus sp. OK048 TaxID=1882761 RepID=UPI0008848C55|nr:hypothetical protein [Bacillus sp. OK048]SDM16990.1 hypothetical protein SAMN05443253_102149 [Bacillus sp. OK048]
MNFTLLKIENSSKLKSLSKNKINFFKKDEEISLFHFNKLDNDLFHAVFNISDEYLVSTKKLGNQHNFIYSSLINFFFFLDNNFAIIEFINNEYQNDVLTDIKTRTKTSINIHKLDNELLLKIFHSLGGTIKKLYYSNDEDEYFELDYVKEDLLNKIANNNTIDSFTVLFEGQYASVSSQGRISVDNSNQEYLVNFIKRLLNAIN